MNRKEVFELAKKDHENLGKVIDNFPDNDGELFHFGITWNSGFRGILTYGPEVYFPDGWQGKAISRGNGLYTLYAN